MEQSFFQHLRIRVDEGQHPMRLDQYLCSKLGNRVSRTRIQVGIQQGGVRIHEKIVTKKSHLVQRGDLVQIILPNPPRLHEVKGEEIPLDIIYEDDGLLIVNKPAEMVVHPAHGHWTGTLVNGLVHRFGQLPHSAGNEGRPGLLHRIDKGTSGLLVIAKNEEHLAGLAQQFMAHKVERTYYALVWGDMKEERGSVVTKIGRSKADRRIMKTYPLEGQEGKRAITHYQVQERLGYVNLISCRLETGRTHQIRVHMQYLGHPLFGDRRYGGSEVVVGPPFSKYKKFIENSFTIMPHQALHAGTLGFIHPQKKEKVLFSAPLPPAFESVLERWRRFQSA